MKMVDIWCIKTFAKYSLTSGETSVEFDDCLSKSMIRWILNLVHLLHSVGLHCAPRKSAYAMSWQICAASNHQILSRESDLVHWTLLGWECTDLIGCDYNVLPLFLCASTRSGLHL